MKILFVAMPDSVHAARWISQLADQGWEIYLFPAYFSRLHPSFRDISYFNPNMLRLAGKGNNVRLINWLSPLFYADLLRERLRGKATFQIRELALSWAIRQIKPDLVHSLEFQHAASLTLGALGRLKNAPLWYVSNWGSDVFLFGRLEKERARVREILQACDYYSCECERDIALARDLGLRGKVMPVLPNAGGMAIEAVLRLRQAGPPSARRTIVLKGYQNWAGRALVAIQALRKCADLLTEYAINIYSASPEVEIAAELFAQDTGVDVHVIPRVSHEEMLKLYGRARIYIGLSISDGISTSLLEAMIMGAFPIQSCGACANEWFEHGSGGFIVDPDDPQAVADGIRMALQDGSLVDKAAATNEQVARRRLDEAVVRPQVVDIYRDILSSARPPKAAI